MGGCTIDCIIQSKCQTNFTFYVAWQSGRLIRTNNVAYSSGSQIFRARGPTFHEALLIQDLEWIHQDTTKGNEITESGKAGCSFQCII